YGMEVGVLAFTAIGLFVDAVGGNREATDLTTVGQRAQLWVACQVAEHVGFVDIHVGYFVSAINSSIHCRTSLLAELFSGVSPSFIAMKKRSAIDALSGW